MSVNVYKPHVLVLPEDDANREDAVEESESAAERIKADLKQAADDVKDSAKETKDKVKQAWQSLLCR